MITQERLHHVLDYDPETGIFRWKNPYKNGKMKAGDIAGNIMPGGYNQIMVDLVDYTGHRLAWLYVYGEWPEETIDHKDRSLGDRIENLRVATRAQNRWNTGPKKGSSSKWKGVSYDKSREKCWKMAFKVPNGPKIQKRFADEREAAEEYMFLALEHHGEFARFE